MLYQITMAVCSILHGGCHAEVLPVQPPEPALPYQMMIGPQIEMAKWSSEHPEWSIVKWALHPVSRIARS